jgi:hypothetical protein
MLRGLSVVLVLLITGATVLPDALCGEIDDFRVNARRCLGRVSDGAEAEETLMSSSSAEYRRKSVAGAMLLSAAVPGLGQIYAGGRRGYVVGGTMLAVEALAVSQYISNNDKGDGAKENYERFADAHYDRERFYRYVRDTVVVNSPYEDFEPCSETDDYDSQECWTAIHSEFPLSEADDGLFYEQIGVEDNYVFGWDDWDPYDPEQPDPVDLWQKWEKPSRPFPDGIPRSSLNRDKYNDMRESADDYYSKADRFAWMMVIGRVVSMVDAAILVKLRNSDLAGLGSNPRLTFDAGLSGDPNFKVALKMRF